MLSKIRGRVTYANVVVTLALVLAMSGGAYAASKVLITSLKQISPKVLASLKGKNGKAGTNGIAGPAGPAGAAGSKGETGAAGAKGDTGAAGATGSAGATGPAGAKGATGPVGATGAAGAAGATGAAGPKGATGEPWTPNSSLPSKATEKGQWAAYMTAAGAGNFTATSVSIPIPLSGGLSNAHVHFIGEGAKGTGPSEGCPMTGEAENPEAEAGNLCIYAKTINKIKLLTMLDQESGKAGEAGKTGTTLIFMSEEAGIADAAGTWAVTAA